jgi:acetolactate synthase-1/2/3 large subunit
MAPYLARTVRDADLVIALGTRLGDIATAGYTLIPRRLVHIHASPEELGRVYATDLAIVASPSLFATALRDFQPIDTPPWERWTNDARQDFLKFSAPGASPPTGVDLAAVVSYLSQQLAPDAIVTNGAGNYTVWVHRFFTYRQRVTELAPTSGAMGYGFPAAIAAKLRHPSRTVVCFAGDGCFLMYPQELATALQYGAAVIVIVVNNGMYGTIRMHQERRFPGRVSATDLSGPDFVALAKSFGAYAERIETTDAFAAAFNRALEANRPALLELRVDRNQITPDRRLGP